MTRQLDSELITGPIEYGTHKGKDGRPPSLKVTYPTGHKETLEFVAIEGEGFARMRAELWWAARLPGQCPPSVTEALEVIRDLRSQMREPIGLLMEHRPDRQWPEIVCWEFDFSGEPVESPKPAPSRQAGRQGHLRGIPATPDPRPARSPTVYDERRSGGDGDDDNCPF